MNSNSKQKTLKFQSKWYASFPWLHHEPCVDGILCFYCASSGRMEIAKSTDAAFTTNGYKNWKNALVAFQKHAGSHAHRTAILQAMHQKKPIVAQLSVQFIQNQAKARNCLIRIIKCVRYLARQGLAFRGHETNDGNLKQLLNMCAETDASLSSWVERHQDYTSPAIQNELLSLFSRNILRSICQDIVKRETVIFAVIVDGTRDISGTEQESICFRYISDDLQPVEVFMGLYEAQNTSGESICRFNCNPMIEMPT